MAQVLIVDAANVVGSVPDGWWRDRAGAARRLCEGLASGVAGFAEVLVVLEGKARAGVPEGRTPPLAVAHAAASGDDEIVAQAETLVGQGAEVTVATADRGLIARLEAFGVRIVGPRSVR